MNTSIETNKLFNMLLDSESEDECLTNENVCLISGEKLTNNKDDIFDTTPRWESYNSLINDNTLENGSKKKAMREEELLIF